VSTGDIAAAATVFITPPASGCAPVSYVVLYMSSSGNASTLTQPVPSGTLQALLNLWPGETYSATVVGTCAGGAQTAPSNAVVFQVPAIPPCESGSYRNSAGGCSAVGANRVACTICSVRAIITAALADFGCCRLFPQCSKCASGKYTSKSCTADGNVQCSPVRAQAFPRLPHFCARAPQV
jgi:hypothetical protein